MATIKDLKRDQFFTLVDYDNKECPENRVWVRGWYDRSTKKYAIYRFDDICHERFVSGKRRVFTEMIF